MAHRYGAGHENLDTLDNFITGTLVPEEAASPSEPGQREDTHGGTNLDRTFVPAVTASDPLSLPPTKSKRSNSRRIKAFNILGMNVKPRVTYKPHERTVAIKPQGRQLSGAPQAENGSGRGARTSRPPWYSQGGKATLPTLSEMARDPKMTSHAKTAKSKASVAAAAAAVRVKSASQSTSTARGNFSASRKAGPSSRGAKVGLKAAKDEMLAGTHGQGYGQQHEGFDTYSNFTLGSWNPKSELGQFPEPRIYHDPSKGTTESKGVVAGPYGRGHEEKDTFSHMDPSTIVPEEGTSVGVRAPKYGAGHEDMDTQSAMNTVAGQLSTEAGATTNENQLYGQHYHDNTFSMTDTTGNLGVGMIPTYASSGPGQREIVRAAAAAAKKQHTRGGKLVFSYPAMPVYARPDIEGDVRFVGEKLKTQTAAMFKATQKSPDGTKVARGLYGPPRVVRLGYAIAGAESAIPDATLFKAQPWRGDSLESVYSGTRRGDSSEITVVFPGKVILKPADPATAMERL